MTEGTAVARRGYGGRWPNFITHCLPACNAVIAGNVSLTAVQGSFGVGRVPVDDKSRCVTAAAEQGCLFESAESEKANAAFDRMMAALAELRSQVDRGEAILVELLGHPDGWVRLSAATHLLPLRADPAAATLEDLASSPRAALRFEAKMALRKWRAGRLKTP